MDNEESGHPEARRDSAPPRFDTLYWSHFLLGCGFLTPWNAFLGAIDYFKDIYPGYHVLQWVSICFIPAKLVAVLLNGLVPTKDRGHMRISIGLLALSFTVLLLPIMDWTLIRGGSGTDSTFALLLLCAVIAGFADGISEGSFTGIALYLPHQYYQGYLRGDGFSALIAVSLRALTKVAFTDSADGLRLSASVFFVVASSICIASLVAHRCIIVRHVTFEYQSLPKNEIEELSLPINGRHEAVPESSEHTHIAGRSWWQAALTLRVACLTVFITAFVTLAIYPTLPAEVENAALGDWYGVMLVAIFSIGDFAARQFPNAWFLTQPDTITVFVLLRFLLIPTSYVAARLCDHPTLISLLVLIVAVTQGYFCTCSFGIGQRKMQDDSSSFDAGNILAFALMAGLSCGSVASIILTAFI